MLVSISLLLQWCTGRHTGMELTQWQEYDVNLMHQRVGKPRLNTEHWPGWKWSTITSFKPAAIGQHMLFFYWKM